MSYQPSVSGHTAAVAARPWAQHFAALAMWIGVVGAAVGCARPGPVTAERQECVECALRQRPDSTDPSTLPQAEEQFGRWCAEGDSRSCSVLGVMYEFGRGVARDEQKAVVLYTRACRDNNARACVSLGRMMELGTAARADIAGATTMYDSACRSGDQEGCVAFARMLFGEGALKRSANILKRGCRTGHAPACEALGVMAEQGRGVAKNARRAQKLFRRACKGGSTQACARL